MNSKQIKPWHIVAITLAGVAVGLAIYFLSSDAKHSGPYSDSERNVIYESGLAACVESANAELANAQAGISEEGIQAYCACAMGDVVKQLTDAEIALYYESETFSESTMSKMQTAAEACAQQFLTN